MDMTIAAGLGRSAGEGGGTAAGGTPQCVEGASGKCFKARVGCLQLRADLLRVQSYHAAIHESVGYATVGTILAEAAMTPGVAAKGVTFGYARPPVVSPCRVQGLIAALGPFLSDKEGCLDLMFA